MPESKAGAKRRAKKLGYPQSNVVKAKTGSYFIAPLGITSAKVKRMYADCRAKGGKKSTCAAVAHNLQKRGR